MPLPRKARRPPAVRRGRDSDDIRRARRVLAIEVAAIAALADRLDARFDRAVALLAGFVLRQARAANPLIPLRVFRSATVTGANLIQMLMVAGIFGVFFLGALYLQQVLHYDPIKVGLAFLPVALGIAGMSLGFSAALIERFGARTTLLPSLVLVAAGLLLFRQAPVHASYFADILPAVLPLTARLERTFATRAAGLPAPARRVLLAAAVDDEADLAEVLAVAGRLAGPPLPAIPATQNRAIEIVATAPSAAPAIASTVHSVAATCEPGGA